MGSGSVVVRADPRDFGFECLDPFDQLTLRIGVERLGREPAGGIALASGAFVLVHDFEKMGIG